MEFVRSFFKRHAGKPVVAWLLKLIFIPHFEGAELFTYFICARKTGFLFLFNIANKASKTR